MSRSSSLSFASTLLTATLLAISAQQVSAQEVIADDLIVGGSLCVGADCADGEEFLFDTLRLKSATPVLQFLDTSASSGFPSNDWSMGVTHSDSGSVPRFFLKDDSGDAIMLILQSGEAGGVALGAGSVIEPDAISVGNSGGERRVAFVADGTAPTDAATKGQLDAFISVVESAMTEQLSSDRAALDSEIAELESELAGLLSRLESLEAALGN